MVTGSGVGVDVGVATGPCAEAAYRKMRQIELVSEKKTKMRTQRKRIRKD
jgi:hypothetical protein